MSAQSSRSKKILNKDGNQITQRVKVNGRKVADTLKHTTLKHMEFLKTNITHRLDRVTPLNVWWGS